MGEGIKELEELGKHFLSVALAFLIVGVITPLAQGKADVSTAFVFFLLWLFFVVVGVILIRESRKR
ncbi:hypothetical protein [Hydrogenivirga sp.]